MMKFGTPKCPTCGELASSTLERILGSAELTFDDDGIAEYTGDTRISWDTQETVEDSEGCVTLACDDGHEWQSRMEEAS